ncbi:hypothetical protein RHPLAN_00390 [Rhodoplanes sp. Z2-YC6860]|nr:hypothetical protein RHPLAN_00390 [Rhodoplanes sp. Z2-YC6860]
MWRSASSIDKIPTDRDLRLAVIDALGKVHALVFPCRRIGYRLVDARSERTVDVRPTHWQDWVE